MKLGIIGTGMIVTDVLNAIEDLLVEKIYIYGRSEDKASLFNEKYHLDGYFTDYDEILDSDVDTIYIALPNYLHYEFSKKALLKDKHVIIEKPITSHYEELKELKEIAFQRHLIIIEAMNLHYLPGVLSIKDNLSLLGDIKIVNLNFSQYSSRYNAFKEGVILPVFDYHKSGGALYDLNVYNIHFVIDLFGEPKDVYYYPNIEKGIDTSGILIMDYPRFKVIAIGAKDCKAPMMNTIQGNDGNIVVDKAISQMTSYSLSKNNKEEIKYQFDTQKHRLYYEFKEFIRIIDKQDYQTVSKMLEISSIACRVMEKARQVSGIVFDADKEKK